MKPLMTNLIEVLRTLEPWAYQRAAEIVHAGKPGKPDTPAYNLPEGAKHRLLVEVATAIQAARTSTEEERAVTWDEVFRDAS